MENVDSKNMRRIQTLEEHRELLKHVFKTAKHRVLVVSPFVSASALKADNVCELVREAVSRFVSVTIYTDDLLNKEDSGELKQSAAEGMAGLTRCGAAVKVVSGIHNKTLIRDYDLITEGSFNWLSAVRTADGVHQREERTLVVEGEEARVMVYRVEKALKEKKPYSPQTSDIQLAEEEELQRKQWNERAWKSRKRLYLWVVTALVAAVFLTYHFIDKGGGIFIGGLLSLCTPIAIIADARGFRSKRYFAPDQYEYDGRVFTDPTFAALPYNIYHKK